MQPGEAGDVLVRLGGVVAQLRDGLAGLGRGDLRAGAHQPVPVATARSQSTMEEFIDSPYVVGGSCSRGRSAAGSVPGATARPVTKPGGPLDSGAN